MKLTCCTGERRNKEIIRRIQKTHKQIWENSFQRDIQNGQEQDETMHIYSNETQVSHNY